MKIITCKTRRTQGTALLTALIIGGVLCVSITGYLSFISFQSTMSSRSQTWNTAIAVVEAGIEEGMAHLNTDTDDLASEGWGWDGTNYVMDHDFGNGTSYIVKIDGSNPFTPTITSEAKVSPPTTYVAMAGLPFLATVGSSQPAEISRAVKVSTARGNLFIKAMVAKLKVDMKGNNILTDSFDSADPTWSTGGQYDPTKTKNNGDVAVNSSIVNGINSGNANIYGHAATGPDGTIAVNVNGGVGDKTWVATHPGQIEPGWFADNMNFTFPAYPLPYTSGLQPLPQDVIDVTTTITSTSNNGNQTPTPGTPGVVTNVTLSSSSNYPGNQSGMTTNSVFNSSSTWPGGATPGPIVTNNVDQSSRTWPGGSVGTITTNVTVTTSSTLPNPLPGTPITTNFVQTVTSTTYPSPAPASTVTTNTTLTKTKTYPAAGTFVGTPWSTGVGKDDNWWNFYKIVSYSWNTYQYAWNVYTYLWTTRSYTYPVVTYFWPNYSYSWNTYTTNYFYTTNHYDYYLASGNYYLNSLLGKTYVAGDANLVVAAGVQMSGNDLLTIGQNGKLHMYIDGPSSAISGNGVLNKSGYAGNCIIACTENVTSLKFNGNGEFIGVLVAPEALLTLDGGGKAVTDFIGAVVANIITLNGHFKFHYDEALGRLNGDGRFLITSWDEIKPGL